MEVASSSLGLQTPVLSSEAFEMQASLLKHSSVADGSHARKHERESAASQAYPSKQSESVLQRVCGVTSRQPVATKAVRAKINLVQFMPGYVREETLVRQDRIASESGSRGACLPKKMTTIFKSIYFSDVYARFFQGVVA